MKTLPFSRSPLSQALGSWRLISSTFISAMALLAAQPAGAVMVDLGGIEATSISGDGKVVGGRIGWSPAFWSAEKGFEYLPKGLGTDSTTLAYSVSRDGRFIVGTQVVQTSATRLGRRAVRWDTTGGKINIGTFGGDFSAAYGTNNDGTVVVGEAHNAAQVYRAFRWEGGKMTDLGSLAADGTSRANGVSGDGKVVVGSSGDKAFRWTTTKTTMTDLGTLGGASRANATNHDGSVVVGESLATGTVFHAFRWTAATGMRDLGTLGGAQSYAKAVNADGSVVVGSANQADGALRAYRWTQASGMTNLGTLSGTTSSEATGVSDDGNTVVGNSGNRAFIWTPDSPAMQDLAYLQTSLILSADTVNHLMASQQRRLRDLNQTHCQPVGNQRACLGLDATTYRGKANGEGNQRNLQFAGGLRLNEHYAVGANAVLGASELDVQSAEQRKAFALGLWAAYQQNPDATGWGADASVAAGQSDNSFERGVNLTDVQRAHAQLDMNSTTLRLAAHYGLQLHGSLVTPEIALSHQRTEQNGFTERNVAFPLTVNASNSRDTYASLGVRSATKMSPQGTLHLSLAVDTLLSDDTPDIEGSSKVPGLSHFTFATSLEKRRAVPVAMAGYSHALDANSTVGGGVQVGASPYQGERAVLGVGVQYRYAF